MEYRFCKVIFLALFFCFYSAHCFIIEENPLTLQAVYAYQYDIE